MKRAALALVLAACSSSVNDFPPLPEGALPGGTSGGGGTRGDAGIGDGSDGGVSIRGSVCLVKDLRAPTSNCNPTKAGGLTVTLDTAGASGTATATTGADGRFAIAAQLDAGLPFTWHVTGTNLVTSVMIGTGTTIPAILVDDYTSSLLDIGLQPADEGHGSVLVQAVTGLAPAAGITATLAPPADSDTFYDGGSPRSAVWNNTSTQSAGVVWLPGVPLPGPVTVTLTRTDGTIVQVKRVVERQAITFVTQDLQ